MLIRAAIREPHVNRFKRGRGKRQDLVVFAVDAALTVRSDLTRRCLPADTNLDYGISVDEVLAAISRALGECP